MPHARTAAPASGLCDLTTLLLGSHPFVLLNSQLTCILRGAAIWRWRMRGALA